MRKTIIIVAVATVVAFMALAVYAMAAEASDACCPKKAAAPTAAKAECPKDGASCPTDKALCPMDANTCPMKAGTAAKKTNTAAVTCPVMKGKVADIKTAKKSAYKGKTYYFCCPGCKAKFDKDPAKYLRTAPKATAKAQDIRCPVMGGKVTNTKTAQKSTYKGKTYYFCCAGCKPKFDANPAKYVKG